MPQHLDQLSALIKRAAARLHSMTQSPLYHQNRLWNHRRRLPSVPMPNAHNILVGLPPELILLIADFLTPAEKVILSLSSTWLRLVLIRYSNLSLSDKEDTLDFLLLLERDMPKYLTCRPCARLYKWKRQRNHDYACPTKLRSMQHFMKHRSMLPRSLDTTYTITQQHIDLVFRAHYRGPSHGLPLSSLTSSMTKAQQHMSTDMSCEGRIINGRFIVARSLIMTLDVVRHNDALQEIVCRHRSWYRPWHSLANEQVQSFPKSSPMYKCRYCATDYREVRHFCEKKGWLRIGLYIWRDYGQYQPGQRLPLISGMSDHSWEEPLDNHTLELRHLEHDFNDCEKWMGEWAKHNGDRGFGLLRSIKSRIRG